MKKNVSLFLIPATFVLIIWAGYMHSSEMWGLFSEYWFMTVTMIFGSFIAGASSEGGGAIAYPVMTLIFNIEPDVARNFSFAIQSIGMTFAAIWILLSGIKIEKQYLLTAGLGGAAGILFGTFSIVPFVLPAYAKMMFVSFWLSFGIAIFVVNFLNNREALPNLPKLRLSQYIELAVVGFIGGIFSSILGNGVDICTFSYVVLKYGLSEKVATPTSVILMASNAIIGFFLHTNVTNSFQTEAFEYWLVSIPVVIFGAPVGAFVINFFNRKSIASLLIAIIIIQFISAMFIIRPGSQLVIFSMLIFIVGLFLFFVLTKFNAIPKGHAKR
ncbi:MAG TPA: sulfite exporter TauE/SafE family protein [Balneolaceae bacterium]|nr:sulfite exporter TauE/SafE family protein [Balneolaceae bacterium]